MSNPFHNIYLAVGHIKRWRVSTMTLRLTIKNLTILLLLFSIISYLWLLLGPIRPASYSDLHPVTPNPVAGESLTYAIYRCRFVGSNVTAHAIVTLLPQSNSKLLPITISSNQGANDKSCGELEHQVAIPSDTPVGWYVLHIVGTYTILPIRNVSVETSSKPFYIKSANTSQRLTELQNQINTLQQQLELIKSSANSLTTVPVASAPVTSAPLTSHSTPSLSATKTVATTAPSQPAQTSSPSSSSSGGSTGANGSGSTQGSGGTTPPPPASQLGLVQDILHFLF